MHPSKKLITQKRGTGLTPIPLLQLFRKYQNVNIGRAEEERRKSGGRAKEERNSKRKGNYSFK